MTTETLNKSDDRAHQRHPQGRAAGDAGRAYRHHQLRRAPDHRRDGQDELHQPRPRARRPTSTTMMLEDKDCSIILVIAGSTSAGGCMDLYADLVQLQHGRRDRRHRRLDRRHGFLRSAWPQALPGAIEIPDDDTLRSLYIDRIYDTYIDEEELQDCDHTIGEIADSLEPRAYSSRARSSARWASG